MEPNLSGYVEKHHIIPRAFGGTNDDENMISLSAEDHIRAHLLLAKIHGGTMWAPVLVLCSEVGGRIPSKKAVKIAAMARAHHGEAMSGNGNPFYGKNHSQETLEKLRDQTIHRIGHKDGRFFEGTKTELETLTGLNQKAVWNLSNGIRNICHGWFNFDLFGAEGPPSKKEAICSARRKKQSTITLYHRDGREWSGFPADAPIKLYSLLDGTNKHVRGWFLSKDERDGYEAYFIKKCELNLQSRGDINGINNPRADRTLYNWRNIDTDEVIKSTRVDMWKTGRCPKAGLSAIFSGKQTKAGRWEKL